MIRADRLRRSEWRHYREYKQQTGSRNPSHLAGKFCHDFPLCGIGECGAIGRWTGITTVSTAAESASATRGLPLLRIQTAHSCVSLPECLWSCRPRMMTAHATKVNPESREGCFTHAGLGGEFRRRIECGVQKILPA